MATLAMTAKNLWLITVRELYFDNYPHASGAAMGAERPKINKLIEFYESFPGAKWL